MFGRKQKESSEPEPPVKMIDLKLVTDDGSFAGDDGAEIKIRGFNVCTSDGQALCLSESGPTIEGIFYFRLAGATHHSAANKLDGDSPTEVFLLHEPSNRYDHNAIQILNKSDLVGYVPAVLAPIMLPHLINMKSHQGTNEGSLGAVVKTFHKGRLVVGGEVLAVAHGYGVNMSNSSSLR